ncbi:MliC family protein [Pseudomonas sp. CLCA07]
MKTVTTLFTCLLVSLCAATIPFADAAKHEKHEKHAKPAKPAPTYKTSFDCGDARARVEKLICHDPQLAQMDIELMRLYRLALTDEHSVPPPNKVMLDQQFWIDGRNQCGTAAEPKACTVRSYAERAHQLRQGSAIVRTKDPDRLTDGPLTFRCTGLNGPIAATFFTTQPGVVYLKWANASITLNQMPSDSGTRYIGKDYKGNYSFRQNENGVFFQKPGSGEMSCTVEPVG